MNLIKQLARELAQRDFDGDFSPAGSIEELKTVLAGEILKAYGEAYHEIQKAAAEKVDSAETRIVSDGDRATLAYTLQRAATGEVNPSAEFLRTCARVITAPTMRELELDELVHSSYINTLLVFAEEEGKDVAPVAARKFRLMRDGGPEGGGPVDGCANAARYNGDRGEG